jgi:uncharacterized protein (TIGR03067 family)
MNTAKLILRLASLALALTAASVQAQDEAGFRSIFNGQDLNGWDGNPKFWSVSDGTITGRTTAENPTKGNTFIVWKGGEVADFELRLSFKIVGGNSGIQYRSKVTDQANWVVGGYQADFEAGTTYSGILYEERGRGILAQRGQMTWIQPDGKIRVVGTMGKSEEIQGIIKQEQWNDYVVIARGNHLTHIINGRVTADVVDDQAEKAAKSGILALQLHAGPPMVVQFKNIRIKTLEAKAAAADLRQLKGKWKGIAGMINGEKLTDEQAESIEINFTEKSFRSSWQDGSDKGDFVLNEQSSPRELNLTSEQFGKVSAIYSLAGDTLTICYAMNGAARPKSFEAPGDSSLLLVVYKRAS